MPNICSFEMKVRGKKENCMKWLKKINYDDKNHFWRVFNMDTVLERGNESDFELDIIGSCAWSLEACCRNSHPVDYSNDFGNGQDLFAENTKDLNLVMEVFSEEGGCCFAEHYIYDKGVCKLSDCVDFFEGFWDKEDYPTYDELKKQYPLAPDEKTLEANDGWWTQGGFNNEFCSLFQERSRF